MRFSLFLLFCISVATFANAQDECRSLESDAARLACYDTSFGVLETEETPSLEESLWDKRVDISPLTDDKNVYLRIESTNSIRGKYSGSGPASLLLRCRENTTAVIFTFNGHHMTDHQNYGKVEYRLDELDLSTISTSASTDNRALGLWNGRQAIPFIQRMLGHNQMIVRALPFSESSITATFDIRGIDTAISELRDTCGW